MDVVNDRTVVWPVRLRQWQEALRGPSLSLLLGVQVLFIFLIVPLVGTGMLDHAWINGLQLLLALVSVFVIPGIGLTRVVIGAGFALTLATTPHPTPSLHQSLLHSMGLFLFLSAVTWGIGRVVFSAGEVTHHRVQGAVVVYLNLALIFATVFDAMTLLLPAAFSHVTPGIGHQFGTLLYFSLSTLTTTGFGDIVPVHPIARSLSNLESATGQIYQATLLARLVSLHVAHRKL